MKVTRLAMRQEKLRVVIVKDGVIIKVISRLRVVLFKGTGVVLIKNMLKSSPTIGG